MRLFTALGAFLFSGIVAATPLHDVVVFGDSLSDNGNLYEFMRHQLPPSPPYFEGRFSNGPVWIEHLMASYFPGNTSSHLFDYAYGGAGVSEEDEDDVLFTLRREINTYLLAHDDKASPDSLFVVWIGSNNYLGLPSDVEKTIEDVNEGIVHSLKHLADKGAKHVLIVNLPDLGRIPAAIEFDSVDILTYFAKKHNSLLDKTIADFKEQYPAVEWLYFDLNEAFNYLLEHPKEYGITNITDTCSNSLVNKLTKTSVLKMVSSVTPKLKHDACDGYLFFDLVHPTAQAHEILAEKARVMLDNAGVTFSD